MNNTFHKKTTLFEHLAQRPKAVAALLIFAATLAAYGTILLNGFHFDDETLILTNELLREPGGLPQLLRTPFLKLYYRPLVTLSFFIDHRIWGLSGTGFHLTNLLLHFTNALLAFFFIRLLFDNYRLAVLTGILFAVHPVQAIPLNYIADRGNLLVTLFTLSGMITLISSFKDPRRAKNLLLLSGLSLLCALLARENAVLFPFLAGASILAARRESARSSRLFILLALAATAAFLICRQALIPFSSLVVPNHAALISWKGITTFAYVIFSYLRGMLLPGDIHMIREIQAPAWGGAQMIVFPALLTGLIIFCLIRSRKRGPVFFGLGWFLICTLPLYGFMFSRPQIGFFIQDNQVYLASLGPLLLIALGIDHLSHRTKKPLWIALVIALTSLYATKALSVSRLYHDEEAFLKEWVRLSPRSDLATFYLGSFYWSRGEAEKAIPLYKHSLTGNITDASAHTNMGAISFGEKDYLSARTHFQNALAADPTNKEALYSLGLIALHEGDFAQGERLMTKAANDNPHWSLPRIELIRLFTQQNRTTEALRMARNLKKRFPSITMTYYLLTWLELLHGDLDAALDTSEELLTLSEDIPGTCGELAVLFGQAGHTPLANAFLERSQKSSLKH